MPKAATNRTAVQQPPDLGRLAVLQPVHRIEGRNSTKATVLFYRVDGVGVALKTYEFSPVLVRRTLGRWMTGREAKAYRAAAGAAGLPAFLGRPKPWAIATEWLEDRTLAELRGSAVSAQVFERLAAVIDELHGRGVALWDLHHRDVLVADDETVRVVDLAMARTVSDRSGPIRRFLFERAREADHVAVARITARYSGGDIAAAVASVGGSAARWHRRGRRFRAVLDRLRGKRETTRQETARDDEEESRA